MADQTMAYSSAQYDECGRLWQPILRRRYDAAHTADRERPTLSAAKERSVSIMDDTVDELAIRIFTHMAAQHTVRHGVHDTHVQALSLVRESYALAEAFVGERSARAARSAQERECGFPTAANPSTLRR